MVGHADYRRAGVPASLLGCSFKNWQRSQLRIVLDHFEQTYRPRASKLELMGTLHAFSLHYVLASHHKHDILRAHRYHQEAPVFHLRPRSQNVFSAGPTNNIGASGVNQIHMPQVAERAQPNAILEIGEVVHNTPENTPECIVCSDTLNESNTPTEDTTSACRHGRDICRQCIATSVVTQFREKTWDQIDCPNCSERLNYHDVRSHAETDTFER